MMDNNEATSWLKRLGDDADRLRCKFGGILTMLLLCEDWMVEIEGILKKHKCLRFDLKRNFNRAIEEVEKCFITPLGNMNKDAKNAFWRSSRELDKIMRIFTFENEKGNLYIEEGEEFDSYVMNVGKTGDVFIKSKEGYVIRIPKQIAERMQVMRVPYEKAVKSPVNVDVSIYIRESKGESPSDADASGK